MLTMLHYGMNQNKISTISELYGEIIKYKERTLVQPD
jgi:hypothetical protein